MVVGLEIYRNGILGVKEDLVVLTERDIFVVFDLGRDRNDAAGNRWNLRGVGQRDAALGLTFWLILADQDAGPDRLDVLEDFLANFGHDLAKRLNHGGCHNLTQGIGLRQGKVAGLTQSHRGAEPQRRRK